MNAKLKNTRETVKDDYTMSLELKCKMLEEKVRRLEEECSLTTQIFINAQNMAFDYSNKLRLLQKELDEIKYPSSHKVRHLQVLRD